MTRLTKKFNGLILLGLIIIGLGQSSCVYYNTFYNAKRFFREGQKENENNTDPTKPRTANYLKAIDSAARVLEYYPKSKYVDDALLIMGKAYFESRNFPKAKRKFEEILANYPQSSLRDEARLWLGRTYIAMGQVSEGITTLTNLWSEQGTESICLQSQRSLADYYFNQKNYRQALLEYEKILPQSKDDRERADVWYQTGECRYILGEYSEAEKAYHQVQAQRPTRKRQFEGEYKRSLTLRRLGDPQGALKICETLIKNRDFFPFIDQAYLTKAEILADLGRFPEAEVLFKRVIELYPRTDASAKACYLLGRIYLDKSHEFDKAEEYLGKVQTEKAGSEFALQAQSKVQDLHFLKSLTRQIDSLNLDQDTLHYQLTWIAEHPTQEPGVLPGDTLETAKLFPDSLPKGEGEPEFLARQMYQNRPDQRPGQSPDQGFDPGSRMPGMEDPRMQGMGGMQGQPGQTGKVVAPIRLAPLPLDSTAVNDRLSDDAEMMSHTRYRLAEHLWFQFTDYDSARTLFSELTKQDEYPDLAARSLLSLYNLIRQAAADTTLPDTLRTVKFDTSRVDTLLQSIHENFANTIYDRWVRPRVGLEPLPDPVDTAELMFRLAEDLYWVENNDAQAAKEYLKLSEKHPDSEFAPKALFAAAWLDEFQLNRSESAKALYDTLISRYPQSDFAVPAKRKLTPLPPEKPDSTVAGKDTTQLSGELALTGPAPTGSGEPELIGGQEAVERLIHESQWYPQVALDAEISGDVVIRFTVNAQGVPSNFSLIREEPQGFDFGQMAIQALQSMRYKPAYDGGQYIEGTLTQLVRFTP
jgi:TonB family protein